MGRRWISYVNAIIELVTIINFDIDRRVISTTCRSSIQIIQTADMAAIAEIRRFPRQIHFSLSLYFYYSSPRANLEYSIVTRNRIICVYYLGMMIITIIVVSNRFYGEKATVFNHVSINRLSSARYSVARVSPSVVTLWIWSFSYSTIAFILIYII